jgi:NAD+ diphosphatase
MQFKPAITPPVEPTPQQWQMAFVNGQLLLPEPEDQSLAPQQASTWQKDGVARHYLGQLDGLDCWALHLPEAPQGWRRVPLRTAMMGFPEPLAGLASRAAQVLDWDRTHRFCGV